MSAMTSLNRRDLCLSLPALALLGDAITRTARAQTTPATAAESTPAALEHNTVFHYDQLSVKKNTSGEFRAVVQGALPTGEGVEIHQTTLLPGHEPHPPHQHLHEEFLLIREGNVQWMVSGKQIKAGPGDILYARSMELHGVRNIGSTNANYFVVAIGPNLKKG